MESMPEAFNPGKASSFNRGAESLHVVTEAVKITIPRLRLSSLVTPG